MLTLTTKTYKNFKKFKGNVSVQSDAKLKKTENKTCFKQYQIKEGFSISLIDVTPG